MKPFSADMKDILLQRLREKGVDSLIIRRFIKDLIFAFSSNPEMSPFELENYLRQIGWEDIKLDYQTYQLAIACHENGNLEKMMNRLEIEPQN